MYFYLKPSKVHLPHSLACPIIIINDNNKEIMRTVLWYTKNLHCNQGTCCVPLQPCFSGMTAEAAARLALRPPRNFSPQKRKKTERALFSDSYPSNYTTHSCRVQRCPSAVTVPRASVQECEAYSTLWCTGRMLQLTPFGFY